jgi:hypothetical protein
LGAGEAEGSRGGKEGRKGGEERFELKQWTVFAEK